MDNQTRFFESPLALSDAIRKTESYIILCDSNTHKYCLPLLDSLGPDASIVVDAGEELKVLPTLERIWDALIHHGANRQTVLICLGGGVLCDMGGFAAATYQRGIPHICVPTSLMAMADAAHGGKNGINFNGLKNYIGTFKKPEAVWIWPGFLKTLPERELLSGFAEMLKHGIIADRSYFYELSSNPRILKDFESGNWKALLETSIRIKSGIVEQDFNDKGIRQLLNFGHTTGHAFESFLHPFNPTHGSCVAAGMLCEGWISTQLTLLPPDEYTVLLTSLDVFFERLVFAEKDIETIIQRMSRDKKNTDHEFSCVLMHKIGKASHGHKVSETLLRGALLNYIHNG